MAVVEKLLALEDSIRGSMRFEELHSTVWYWRTCVGCRKRIWPWHEVRFHECLTIAHQKLWWPHHRRCLRRMKQCPICKTERCAEISCIDTDTSLHPLEWLFSFISGGR